MSRHVRLRADFSNLDEYCEYRKRANAYQRRWLARNPDKKAKYQAKKKIHAREVAFMEKLDKQTDLIRILAEFDEDLGRALCVYEKDPSYFQAKLQNIERWLVLIGSYPFIPTTHL